jgi:hypothetical protein
VCWAAWAESGDMLSVVTIAMGFVALLHTTLNCFNGIPYLSDGHRSVENA